MAKAGPGEVVVSRTVRDLSPGPTASSRTGAPTSSRASPATGSCSRCPAASCPPGAPGPR
jgi:hypothetical protein